MDSNYYSPSPNQDEDLIRLVDLKKKSYSVMKESGKAIGLVREKEEVFCSMPAICFQYLITLEGLWNVLGKMRDPYILS